MKKTAVFMLTFIVIMGIFLLPRPLAAKEGQVTPQEPEMTVQEKETAETERKDAKDSKAGNDEIQVEFQTDQEYLKAAYWNRQYAYADYIYGKCINQTEADVTVKVESSNTNAVEITSDTEYMAPAKGQKMFQIRYRVKGPGIADFVVTAQKREYRMRVYVVPEEVKIKSIAQELLTDVTLHWEKMPGLSGYRIERAKVTDETEWYGLTYQTIASVYGADTDSVTVPAEPNIKYRYRVIGFVEDEKRRVEGSEAEFSNFILPSMDFTVEKIRPEISSVKISGKTRLRIQWKLVAGATAYKLYRSEQENGAYSCIYTAGSGTNSFEQKVSQGITYHYKVTAVFPKGESYFSKSVSQFIPKKGKKKSVSAQKLGKQYINGQYSGNWAYPDKTYYYKSGGRLYAVCVQKNGSLKVFRITDSLKVKKIKTIKLKYDVWGGFYAGPDGNFYVATGYHNRGESRTKTVIKIIQYNSKWKKGKTAEIKGGATNVFEGIYEPFNGGSLRMDMQGDFLYVATARIMFLHDDGKRHQSNISFLIDTKTMQEKKAAHAYVSHSFNQFVKFKDENLYLLNHGDAYPRNLELSVFPDYSPDTEQKEEDGRNLFSFLGSTGENFTGCKVGGMEIGAENTLVCGTAQPHEKKIKGVSGYGSNLKYNVFLARSNQKTGKVTFQWLTKYNPSRTSVNVGETRMVKLCDDKFAILYSSEEKGKTKLNYVVVNDAGKKVFSRKYPGMAFDGDSQPILHKGKIVWANTVRDSAYRPKTKLCSIPAVY